MSYSDENGQVILSMSREDYEEIMREVFWIRRWLKKEMTRSWVPWLKPIIAAQKHRLAILVDRLNSGNPRYTPYRTGGK